MTSLVIASALQVFYFNHTPMPFHLSLINNPISSLTRVQTIINDNSYLFNHEIANPLPITDQKSSGRCWLFASLNLVRINTFKNWQKTISIFKNNSNLIFESCTPKNFKTSLVA